MPNDSFNSARRQILSNEAARRAYWEQLQRQHAARVEAESQKPDREGGQVALADARASDTPAAEAWMAETERWDDLKPEQAATRGECLRLITLERVRLKAVRARLRQIGIR